MHTKLILTNKKSLYSVELNVNEFANCRADLHIGICLYVYVSICKYKIVFSVLDIAKVKMCETHWLVCATDFWQSKSALHFSIFVWKYVHFICKLCKSSVVVRIGNKMHCLPI